MARSTPNTHTTLKNTAQPHPDALLLRLMAKHAKAQTRVEAAEAALESGAASMSDRAFDRLCWKILDIEDAILAQPTHTPEGLRIQAQIAARYMQAPEDWGWRTYDVCGRFVKSVPRQTAAGRL